MAVVENEIVQNELPKSGVPSDQAERAWEIYFAHRAEIETPQNIGKIIIIDTDSGDYEIAADELGLEENRRLQTRNPNAVLYGLRVGYEAVGSFDGALERLPA